jgi:parallel beta-helix repeat protein
MLLVPINSAYSNIGIQIENKPIITSNRGNTLYVGGNGLGNYTNIQDAVNNASDGDTVFVYDDSSPYYENVVIYKPINLIGEDKNSTIIGRIYGDNINVAADWVNISGFTIQDGEWGIDINYSNHTNITDNKILNNIRGIEYFFSNNNTLKSNIIMYNEIGVTLGVSNYNTIKNNKILQNKEDGIGSISSSNNIFEFNNISNNFEGLFFYKSNSSLFTHNIISNNGYGFLFFLYCKNNKIISNNIINNTRGLLFWENTSNNLIYHNNLVNNEYNVKDNCYNIWDDGKYGNYWSDFKERYPDAIPKFLKPWMWNTPYEIPGGSNKDNCPLVNQWPKSKSKDIPNNKAISSSPLLRFLERYPLLNRLIDTFVK